jgi:hypothetical protein
MYRNLQLAKIAHYIPLSIDQYPGIAPEPLYVRNSIILLLLIYA